MIDVEGLSYTYPGAARPALTDVSFDVGPGEIFGLLGPSGAGKSTVQKIVLGLLTDYRGSVKLFGRERKEWSPDVFERIGVVFELPNFYVRFTALENLRMFASLYRRTRSPERLLEAVGLSEAAHLKVGGMSKGMKMRLNFCRAMLHDPELLLLDEPTSGLDPVNVEEMKRLIREASRRGKTVLLATHDMELAADLCRRVAFVADGRIVLVEEPRRLMLKYGQPKVRVEYREADGRTGRADFPLEGLADSEAFLTLLRQRNIETIHTLEASLGHVFAEVTGRRRLIQLERGQGIRDALSVTPLRLAEYLLAKGVSLALLSLAAAFLIHVGAVGWPVFPIHYALGVVGMSLFFTWYGLAVAAKTRTLNGYLLASQLGSAVFALPLGSWLGFWNPVWTAWLPTGAGLNLLDPVSNASAGAVDAAGRAALLAIWSAGAFVVAHRVCRRQTLGRNRLKWTKKEIRRHRRLYWRLLPIGRNPLLAVALLGPAAVMTAIRFGWKPLADWLAETYGWNLHEYDMLLGVSLLLVIPLLAGCMSGFLLLDERDEGLGAYYAVTPLSRQGYWRIRLTPPVVLAGAFALLFPAATGLTPYSPSLAAALLLAALLTPLIALMLVSFASNKVEGLALSKGLSLLVFIPAAVHFLPDPWRWLLSPLPPFWIAALYVPGEKLELLPASPWTIPLLAAGGATTSLGWYAVFFRRFVRRID